MDPAGGTGIAPQPLAASAISSAAPKAAAPIPARKRRSDVPGPPGPSLAIAVNGRQGYPLPYYRQVARERAGIAYAQLTSRPDAFRTDDLFTVDAQLEKEFAFRDTSFSLSLEASNLLDENTIRRRELDLGTGRGAFADETLASRALRLKVRLWWR